VSDLATEHRRALQALHAATERAEQLGDRYAIAIAKVDELCAARLDHEARITKLEER
jgi:hypothetical protein